METVNSINDSGITRIPGARNASRIVIIDDQKLGRVLLQRLLSSMDPKFQIIDFENPLEAMDWIANHPPDLVLTDYSMPQMDGVEFTRRLRMLPKCHDIPLVIVTGIEDREIRYQAFESGATDFLIKPIDHQECRVRIRNLLTMHHQHKFIAKRAQELEHLVEQATLNVRIREQETLMRLAKAGEYRDEETGNHIIRMARYSRLIAEALNLTEQECQMIEMAAPMHDIGKIGISDTILLKPGKHTENEFEQMKKHTVIGYEILKDSPSEFLQMGAVIALGHHEKYDGSGYPKGLSGQDIPLQARIVAIADVFDALTTVRPYKKAWTLQDAFDYIRSEKGKHFCPDSIDAFFTNQNKILEVYTSLRDEEDK